MKLNPPMYLLICVFFSFILQVIFPIFQILSSPWNFLGLLPLFAGVLLNLWADLWFQKYGEKVSGHINPQKLVKTGPYSLSRNPIYLGMTLVLLGISVLLGSLTAFIPTAAFFFIIDEKFLPHEEKKLEIIFKDKYMEYKKNVRRWV